MLEAQVGYISRKRKLYHKRHSPWTQNKIRSEKKEAEAIPHKKKWKEWYELEKTKEFYRMVVDMEKYLHRLLNTAAWMSRDNSAQLSWPLGEQTETLIFWMLNLGEMFCWMLPSTSLIKAGCTSFLAKMVVLVHQRWLYWLFRRLTWVLF